MIGLAALSAAVLLLGIGLYDPRLAAIAAGLLGLAVALLVEVDE